ncbi:MAG: tRNA (adenosine(37)-N6)-threonylcarbamoyltransferase complex transferase subunit TsaD, partial [Clostridia bacterium]|nr:tRNA (adenosine(37)-N6)-threonylcarbamoyltransferase complex transferase subunit TsaD [Clostridia bacterium]
MKNYEEIAKEKFERLKTKKDVIILGVESSCDETSVSIVKNGREILSNVVATQIEIHRRFGGVVPEVASRNHVLALNPVFDEALAKAGIPASEIDAIAVTYG